MVFNFSDCGNISLIINSNNGDCSLDMHSKYYNDISEDSSYLIYQFDRDIYGEIFKFRKMNDCTTQIIYDSTKLDIQQLKISIPDNPERSIIYNENNNFSGDLQVNKNNNVAYVSLNCSKPTKPTKPTKPAQIYTKNLKIYNHYFAYNDKPENPYNNGDFKIEFKLQDVDNAITYNITQNTCEYKSPVVNDVKVFNESYEGDSYYNCYLYLNEDKNIESIGKHIIDNKLTLFGSNNFVNTYDNYIEVPYKNTLDGALYYSSFYFIPELYISYNTIIKEILFTLDAYFPEYLYNDGISEMPESQRIDFGKIILKDLYKPDYSNGTPDYSNSNINLISPSKVHNSYPNMLCMRAIANITIPKSELPSDIGDGYSSYYILEYDVECNGNIDHNQIAITNNNINYNIPINFGLSIDDGIIYSNSLNPAPAYLSFISLKKI